MAAHFKSLRSDVTAKSPWDAIRVNLETSIVYNRLENYRLGAVDVKRNPDSHDLMQLRLDGVKRAKWVTDEMRGWTEQSLVASKKSRLLSLARANKVAIYENRKAAFTGRLKGWHLNEAAKKEWFLSGDHDTDDICDDNADDGVIDMGDSFSSGDTAPPAHLYCLCSLWLRFK